MCGLFGVVLPRDAAREPNADGSVADALNALGLMAQERGVDASGLATYTAQQGWRTVRTVGPYARLITRSDYSDLTHQPQIALGHTRFATQGGMTLRQASPLTIGSLIGTHNGDLDPSSLPQPAAGAPADVTDSQLLFTAIDSAHRDGRMLLKRVGRILVEAHGRAALAWTDTSRADGRVWLARGGLSPLALAIDSTNAVWWASNPDWLRTIRPDASIRMLNEGTIWSLTPRRQWVTLTHLRNFKPTIRPVDERAAAVWRGFTPADRWADRARRWHRISRPA